MSELGPVGVNDRWSATRWVRAVGWGGALLLIGACAPCPCGKKSDEPSGLVASSSAAGGSAQARGEAAGAAGAEADDAKADDAEAGESVGAKAESDVTPARGAEVSEADGPAAKPPTAKGDPKTILLTQLGRLDEAASWTELSREEIEGSSDRVIAFQRAPEEPDDDAEEEDLPMVEVQIVAVTSDGSVYPIQQVQHRMYDCEDVSIYASPLKDAPQVVWLDVSCRSGEDYWSIEVDSSLHHRPAAGAWTRLWEGTQSVSGQWTACRDAREVDVVVRDGNIVVDELRYRDYTPEPDDHVKRSDCPPKKLRRKELARLSVPAT